MSEKMPAVKLADVAKHAGISTSTVSRVLNGQPGISAVTRRNVLDALRTLGYKSETVDVLSPVRDMRKRINVIICPLEEQKNPLGLAYYGVALEGIRSIIDPEVVNLNLHILSDDVSNIDIDGAVLVGTPPAELILTLDEAEVPHVTMSGNPKGFEGDLVTFDKFAESIRVCNYLVELGVRRIGLLMPAIDQPYCDGLCCGMARHGLKIAPSDIHLTVNTDLGSFLGPIHRMLESGDLPEALVVATYSAADFCAEMMQLKALKIPERMRLVAFADDGSDNNPAYITMRYDTREMGRLAMEFLLRRITAPSARSYRIVVPALVYPDLLDRRKSK